MYHLAGVSDSRQSFLIPEQTLQSITIGTLRILEAGRLQNPGIRFFLASSCEIFGAPDESPQSERLHDRPLTPYAIAKQAADQFARLHREKYGQFVSVGILYNHESPLRPANYLSRRVAKSVAAIKKGSRKNCASAICKPSAIGATRRDFVQGFYLALQASQPDDFIFASGTSRTVREFVETAFSAAGLRAEDHIETDPSVAPTEVTVGLCGNPSKAEKILGWKRHWTFAATVADMVKAEMEDRAAIDRANPTAAR